MHRWPTIRLGDVLELKIDAVPIDPAESYKIAGVYGFGRGLLARGPLLGSETTYKVFHRLHEGDFVISQLKAWEGALAKVPGAFDGWFLSPQFPTFRPVEGKLDISYFDWYCKQLKVWESLRSSARGMGARRDSVSPQAFLSMLLPLPPLEMQRRIVARIEELATKIEQALEARRNADAASSSIMMAALRSTFCTNEPQTLLDEALQLQRGFDLPAQVRVSGPYPVFAANGEVGRHIESRVKGPGVVTGRSGSIGAVNYVEGDFWPLNTALYVRDFRGNQPRLIYYLLRSVSPELKQAASQTAVPTLDRKKAHTQIHVHVPSLSDQGRIVTCLDELQAKVDAVKRLQVETAAELDALLPSILDKAFKGEL